MRRYLVFSISSLALLLNSISVTSVSVAFPVIVSDLSVSLVMAGWVLSIFQMVYSIVMPLSGKISEILGRGFTFRICILLFTIGSILCAIAPTIELLITARIIQAIGSGGFLPCASGIVSDEFPKSRQRAIGLFSSIMPIGLLIGPNLGGLLVESFGWRSVFWFNIPLGIFILGLTHFLLRADHEKSASSLDLIGAGLLVGSVFSLMFGITELGNINSGISWLLIGILFTVSIALMIALVYWERRSKEPLFDLALMREKPFLAANIFNIVYGAFAMGIFLLIPLYAVSIYHMSVFESGLILTPRSIGMILASIVTSIGILKWGYRKPILIGTVLITLSLVLLIPEPWSASVLGFDLNATMSLLIIMIISGIGVGVCAPAANNACIELMPDKVATITGLRGMFRQVGGAISISIATVILHNISDTHLAFNVVFFSAAFLVLLICIPAIFAMPSSPNSSAYKPLKKS